MAELLLDDDPDFCAVLGRAERRHGAATVDAMLDDGAPCPRRRASGRLFIRRFATGSPGSGLPGERPSWSYLDHAELIPAELARMGVEDGPCDDDACFICHPRTCPQCGGIVCAAHGATTAEAAG